MKVGLRAREFGYNLALTGLVAAVLIAAVAQGLQPLSSAVVAGLATLATLAFREVVPSPRERADRERMARQDREIAKFNDPQRPKREMAALNRQSRYGPMFGSRDAGPFGR